jgi:hypothetical protein
MLQSVARLMHVAQHMYAHTFAPPGADGKLQRALIHSLVSKARAVGGWVGLTHVHVGYKHAKRNLLLIEQKQMRRNLLLMYVHLPQLLSLTVRPAPTS